MKVVMVARDAAPSIAFEKLSRELEKGGHQHKAYCGNGKPFEFDVDAVKNADVVLVGMSSAADLVKEEIAACKEAEKHGIPYGLYADTYNGYAREWCAEVREGARFLFVINEGEKQKAEKSGLFSNAKIVVSGNPEWEEFFFPKMSRKEVRAKLRIADDEFMVLCPGHKLPSITFSHLVGVLQAMKAMNEWGREVQLEKWKICFSPHPGDPFLQPLYKKDKKTGDLIPVDYQKFIKENFGMWSDVPFQMVTKDVLPTDSLVAGSDLVVSHGSTTEICAACQRVPAIAFLTRIVKNRMKTNMGGVWEPAEELGVSVPIYGEPADLAAEMWNLLLLSDGDDVEDSTNLRKRQEEVYPKPPEKGAAVRTMVETLEKVARG